MSGRVELFLALERALNDLLEDEAPADLVQGFVREVIATHEAKVFTNSGCASRKPPDSA